MNIPNNINKSNVTSSVLTGIFAGTSRTAASTKVAAATRFTRTTTGFSVGLGRHWCCLKHSKIWSS
jgi:hypothetical protein